MERIQKPFLLGLIGIFIITHLGKAQDLQGSFISLDCGLPSNESNYTEKSTGLTFLSDVDFIRSGESGKIKNAEEYLKPYKHLRYFPDGARNCYSMSVMQGTPYLIRAAFVYDNYDGLKTYPIFDLSLGPNLWTTIKLEDRLFQVRGEALVSGVIEESIHMPKSNSLDVCLVNTGTGTPFISTLELRPLRDDTYTTETGSLKLLWREYYSSTESTVRYPDDIHDRRWVSGSWDDMKIINATAKVDATSAFKIPQLVFSNAGIPNSVGDPLTKSWIFLNPDEQTHVYLHFAEIQGLKPNDTRQFDILWKNDIVYSEYSPMEFMVDTVSLTSLSKCDSLICQLKLVRNKGSTLPPLVNGAEVFGVIPLLLTGTDENDFIAIKNIQATYKLHRISWQGDPCAPVQFMWHGLNCSSNTKLSTPLRITLLDLSSNGLSGTIPREIENLSRLQKLDLSNNNFSGGVPEFLADMKYLTRINLSLNNLNGSIPSSLRKRIEKGLKINFEGNPRFCLSTSCEISRPPDGNNLKTFQVPIIASVISIAFVILLLITIIYVQRKKRQLRASSPSMLASKRSFTYEEITVMTKNFEKVLGEGGFGAVYHGYLNGNEQVAVKLLSQSSAQGYKQFKAEVELLLRVHHINLVTLVGYCDEGNNLVLIYDYMPNGDLKQHLSGECATSLSWENRLRIASETAQGLEYLHTGCQPPTIHRDVKSTNILLDEHFKAKLGDFGLSRSFPMGSETHVSTNVAGSPGYLDPEYYRTNRLTEKSDVYSFGIVLLEIITRRSVIDQTREKPHIAEWVGFRLINGDIENIVDPSLVGDYDSSSLWTVLELAMSCTSPSPSGRPHISQVSNELKMCLSSIENSRKRERPDKDSESSLELNTSFGPEHNPDAR